MGMCRCCFTREGFSTIGVVLALLIVLSLVFTSAQVYRINAASSSIQETADAAALAAENVVAEFEIAVRVCDAVVLSLSLTAAVVTGAGVAALCVPGAASLGGKRVSEGVRIGKARDAFAEKAAAGLNAVQRSLTFLAAAQSAAVIRANAQADGEAGYVGFALLLPQRGEVIEVGGAGKDQETLQQIADGAGEVEQAAKEAEEGAREANAAKEAGFKADCGNAPGYCLYERAATLAELPAAQNPRYTSVDAWSFEVPLCRAQAYYRARLAAEAPTGDSVAAQADSALRLRFYQFAVQQVDRGYVHETDDSFAADFPLLPRNTREMKETSLYTEAVYPVTYRQGKKVLHAFAGCPEAAGASEMGALADLEGEGFEQCPACELSAASMGKVAAASSSIENGFEYHYRAVAQAAQAYQKAREKANPATRKVKSLVKSAFDGLGDLMRAAADRRIEAQPPGRYGAVALVATTKPQAVDEGFGTSFVRGGTRLGTRAALSAAVLVSDDPHEGATVLSSLLDRVRARSDSVGIAGAQVVLDAWSALLSAYGEGQDAVEHGIKEAFSHLPLIGASGLGEWAADAFADTAADLGLQPAKLDAPKPVLVNSDRVLAQDDSAFAVRFLSAKRAGAWLTGGDVFSAGVSAIELSALQKLEGWDGEVTIATIEPFGAGGPSVPVTVALPATVQDAPADAISALAARLRDIRASISDTAPWR